MILCLILLFSSLAFADFYCWKCGKLIKEGSNYCGNCGTSFEPQQQQRQQESGNVIAGIINLAIGAQQYHQQRKYQKQQEEYIQMNIDQQRDICIIG